jgi:hypothetical protein
VKFLALQAQFKIAFPILAIIICVTTLSNIRLNFLEERGVIMKTFSKYLIVAVLSAFAGASQLSAGEQATHLLCDTETFLNQGNITKTYQFEIDEFGNVDAQSGVEPLGTLLMNFKTLQHPGELPDGSGKLIVYMKTKQGNLFSYSTLIPGTDGIQANLENINISLDDGRIAKIFKIVCTLGQ